VFTFFRATETAQALSEETGAQGQSLDVTNADALRDLIAGIANPLQTIVHCITTGPNLALERITDADWDHLHAVMCALRLLQRKHLRRVCVNTAATWCSP
jgi:hypothetical protein